MERVVSELKWRIEGEVLSDEVDRALYSTDASIYEVMPITVVLPKSVEDVVKVVRYCQEHGIPLHPRGGGTGVAGQCIGKGVVMDFSKYMNEILEIDAERGYVVVQPGVVLSELNEKLKGYGKWFPPDPSTADYCTIGGMIGNNASGAHSVRYGATIDHVVSLKVVLSDGKLMEAKRVKLGRNLERTIILDRFTRAGTSEGRVYAEMAALVTKNEALIRKKVPRVPKNSSGYRLERVLDGDYIDLSKLFIGSEGTLGVIIEAKLKIADLPRAKGLVLLYFTRLDRMGKAVTRALKLRPAAVELMDSTCIELVRRATPKLKDKLPEGMDALLLVEFDGESPEEVRKQIRKLKKTVKGLAVRVREVRRPSEQREMWDMRKSIVPILRRVKGPKRTTAFIEDTAVSPSKIAKYVGALRGIFKQFGLTVPIYGHVGEGTVHTRVLLDLKYRMDLTKMARVAEKVYRLAIEMGGTVSGEHGDGRLRPYFAKLLYNELFDVFKEVKGILDETNILNPDLKLNPDPGLLTRDLRFGEDYRVRDEFRSTKLAFENFPSEVERCQGCGKCRTTVVGNVRMCPMFRATLNERHSPRGVSNLWRWTIKEGGMKPSALYSDLGTDIIFTCLQCKSCSIDCPSLINVPRLVLEARARYAAERGLPRSCEALSNYERYLRLGQRYNSLAKWTLRRGSFKWFMEKTMGIDRRRVIPKFSDQTFSDWFKGASKKGGEKRVAYFHDVYVDYIYPKLGEDVVHVLERNGFDVMVPKQVGSGIAALTYGKLEEAKKAAETNVGSLAKLVEEGAKVVCSSVSAAYAIKKEYVDLLDSKEARLVAYNTHELGDFLLALYESGDLDVKFSKLKINAAYHAPCHLRALDTGLPSLKLLNLIPGVKVMDLNSGCCGLAGTFGMSKEHFDLSMKVGEALFEAIRSSGVDTVVTECEGCKMQIEQGTGVRVLHPAEVLHMAYRSPT